MAIGINLSDEDSDDSYDQGIGIGSSWREDLPKDIEELEDGPLIGKNWLNDVTEKKIS